MAREHREKHKAHLDSHIRDASGAYHYVGSWYVLNGGRRALTRFALGLLVSAAALIGAGCVDFPGMRNTFYVILPYLFAVIALFGLGWNGVRLLSGGGRLKAYDWDKVHDKIVPAAWALTACAVLTVLCGGVSVLIRREPLSLGSVCFFVLLLLAGAGAYLTQRTYRAQHWSIEE